MNGLLAWWSKCIKMLMVGSRCRYTGVNSNILSTLIQNRTLGNSRKGGSHSAKIGSILTVMLVAELCPPHHWDWQPFPKSLSPHHPFRLYPVSTSAKLCLALGNSVFLSNLLVSLWPKVWSERISTWCLLSVHTVILWLSRWKTIRPHKYTFQQSGSVE